MAGLFLDMTADSPVLVLSGTHKYRFITIFPGLVYFLFFSFAGYHYGRCYDIMFPRSVDTIFSFCSLRSGW